MSITSRINEMSSHIEQAYDELQGLGADLTNVNKNIENISMVLDDIYDSMPQVSGEGTSLTLDDTRVGKIKSTLKGNTSQTGTPTPTSPIPVNVVSGDNEINVVGKNLLNYNVFENRRINCYTINDDKTITQTASDSNFWQSNYLPHSIILNSGTYTISVSNRNGSTLQVYNLTTSSNITERKADSYTFTLTNDNQVINVKLYDASSYPFTFTMQIEKGSTASTYEPFNGNTYNIDLPVENLFNKDNLQQGYINSSGVFVEDNDWKSTNFIAVGSNTNYIISNASGRTLICQYSSNNENSFVETRLDRSGSPITFTTGNNTKYIKISIYAQSGTSISETMQLEKGSKQNTFTPYGTTPIELCKIGNYQDYFYKDSDKWYLHKEIGKIVLNGSETGWTQYANANNLVYFGISLLPNRANGNNVLANYFSKTTNIWGKTSYENGVQISGNNQDCLFITTNYLTIADFKTWLSTHNTNVYYALATPTTTELTYEPLIDQLNLLEKAMSKDGQTNISQVNNDLPFIISASALKEWSV